MYMSSSLNFDLHAKSSCSSKVDLRLNFHYDIEHKEFYPCLFGTSDSKDVQIDFECLTINSMKLLHRHLGNIIDDAEQK